MKIAAWRRTSAVSVGTGLADVDDNDLVKALAGVPPARMGTMDEAFLLLDSGLGAVFSASMARRAAVLRGERLNPGSAPSSPTPSTAGRAAATPRERRESSSKPPRHKGVDLLRQAVRQCGAPRRLLAAQKATLEFSLPHDQEHQMQHYHHRDSPRTSLLSTTHYSTTLNIPLVPVATEPGSGAPPGGPDGEAPPGGPAADDELPPDEEVDAWAQEALGLSPEKLKDPECLEFMRDRLGHQLLCWRALRAEKLPLPGGRGEMAVGEAPPVPEPALLAAQALHSPRPPAGPSPPAPPVPRPFGARRPLAPRVRSVPPVWPPVLAPGTHDGGSLPSSARRAKATAALRPPLQVPAAALDLPGATLPGPLPRPATFLEPHREVPSTALTGTPEFAYLRRCELRGLVPCETAWRGFGKGAGVVDVPKRTLGDKEIGAIVETAIHCAAKGHVLQALDLAGNALSNEGLREMADLLAKNPEACQNLMALSLAGNTPLRLHCESILGDLQRVFAALPSLAVLDLSGVRIHGQAAKRLADALGDLAGLRSLSLVGCGLGQFQEPECVAIASLFRHPDLEHVDLSGNFFGRAGFEAAGAALRESRLKKLSFSQNSSMLGSTAPAPVPTAQPRGARPGSSRREEQPRFHPLQLLIEGFLANTTLTDIDLSGCGMGPDTAFILEDALRSHPSVTSLSLADNPLGDAGLRCVLRLLIDPNSKILNCFVEGHREADDTAGPLKFRPVQPGGIYKLNLRRPLERATLRTLLSLGEKERDGALRPFRFDSKSAKPALDKDEDANFWVVPTQGAVGFAYHLPLSKVAHRLLMVASEGAQDFTSDVGGDTPLSPQRRMAVKRQMSIKQNVNVRPAVVPFRFGNAAPLLAPPHLYEGQPPSSLLAPRDRPDPRPPRAETPLQQAFDATQLASALECSWVEVAKLLQEARTHVCAIRFPIVRGMFLSLSTEDEQLRFVRALAKDMSFNAAQVTKLCEDRPDIATQIAVALFPAVSGRAAQLLILSASSPKRAMAIAKASDNLLWFQEGNVTGRYQLDLLEPADYAVAERVLLVNAWETEVGRLAGRPDVSQRGNYEMLRNETLNDEPFTYGRAWGLPSHGWLAFDYSSIRRPPPAAGAMPEMNEVPKFLRSSTIVGASKLKALRAVSVHMYMTTQQFKNILDCFPAGSEDRQELFCMLHTRVVDPQKLLGSEVLRSPTLLRDVDRQALLKRVGHLHLLNPLHPEAVTYTCCLRVFEERMVVDYLVQLAVKEPGGRVTGQAVGATSCAAMPVSWVDTGVPNEDIVFCCKYETKAPNMAWRRTLAEQYTVGFGAVVKTSTTPTAAALQMLPTTSMTSSTAPALQSISMVPPPIPVP